MISNLDHAAHSRLKLVDFGLSLRFPAAERGASGGAAAEAAQDLCITAFQAVPRSRYDLA